MANGFMRAFLKSHIWIYRRSKGSIMGRIRGVPILLLTTTGRKTGQARTTALGYFEIKGGYLVVASAGGAAQHPAWYLNLNANPQVTIEVQDRRFSAQAETISGAEKAEIWEFLQKTAPDYGGLQAKTQREIPLVRLRPT
jgi:deazaflavin-dependent oxidoreductase (nitroreductase family)